MVDSDFVMSRCVVCGTLSRRRVGIAGVDMRVCPRVCSYALWAASPDLFEACKAALEYLHNAKSGPCMQLASAIAKAEERHE